MLAQIDQYLLRSILGAHPKVAIEQLYLETGAIPIQKVIATRRMIYLQTLLKRPESELTRKIYNEMKVEPQQSDWSEMVKMDFNKNEITLDEEKIKTQSVREYKNEIKRKVREATLRDLLKLQQEHKKARQIIYTDLKKTTGVFNKP